MVRLVFWAAILAMALPSASFAVDWADGDGGIQCPSFAGGAPIPAGSIVEYRVVDDAGTTLASGTCSPGDLNHRITLPPGGTPVVAYEARWERASFTYTDSGGNVVTAPAAWSGWGLMASEVASLPPFPADAPAAPVFLP